MAEETAGTTTGSRQRRKRKWDEPAALISTPGALPGALPFGAAGLAAFPGVLPSYMNYFPSLSTVGAQVGGVQPTSAAAVQQNAAAIVQKINQDLLVSKGILLQSKIQDELIAREITINDAEAGVRYRLTKRQTQEEIQVKTGAVVITRGRYRPPNGPVDHEKPLYLHISAGVNLKETAERIKAVDQAAAMVEEMLKQGPQSQGAASRSPVAGNTLNAGQVLVKRNVFVGFEADPSFNLVGRIRGPNNQYLSHIASETGASILLRGKGSGNGDGSAAEEIPQRLHLLISGDKAKSVEDAQVLAENLLETIHADYMSNRMQTYQLSPSVVPAVSPQTYPTSQPLPYRANLPQNPYGAYYPTVEGAFSAPYGAGSVSPMPPMSPIPPMPPMPPMPPPPTYSPATAGWPSDRSAPNLVNAHAGMASHSKPPDKVYGAVPPPSQLFGEEPSEGVDKAAEDVVEGRAHVRTRERFSQPFTSSDSNIPTASTSSVSAPVVSISFTHVASLPSHRVSESQAPHLATTETARQFPPATTSQALASSQPQVPANSLYTGYGGLYPDVSPFQQVAQALQRPPLPVSVRPVANSGLALTKAKSSSSQEQQSEKQTGQRRKFQEFPIVYSSDSASDDQQQGRRRATISAGLEASKISRHQAFTSSNTARASREMLPPPLPFKSISTATSQRAASSDALPLSTGQSPGALFAKESDAPPGTGLKLVEYGEEEDSSPRSTTPAPPKAFANGKPFWAA